MPNVPFPVPLPTLIRSRFHAKPATHLILTGILYLFLLRELYGTRYQSGSLPVFSVGSGFHSFFVCIDAVGKGVFT
jgi:hypothetical protein